MAEITSEVYDIFHPSPVSLKELAAIALSLELWRRELSEYRLSGTFTTDRDFDPPSEESLTSMLPDSPPVIYEMIEKYVRKFELSLYVWLCDHKKVCFYQHHKNLILKYFDDFVCDDYGNIDYIRTAKRMMCCDRFCSYEKFVIACAYFFEDDIRRIWPLMTRKLFFLVDFEFDQYPQLYYWACYLNNKMDKLPIEENNSIDEEMFNKYIPRVGPSIEYFWNRMPLEIQMRKAIDLLEDDTESLVRFILPKLNDRQLNEFINKRGDELMFRLWTNFDCYGDELVLGTWLYIRTIINENTFTNLVAKMLKVLRNKYYLDDGYADREKLRFFQEIWNSAAADLKRSVIRNISSDVLKNAHIPFFDSSAFEININFLFIVLQYASVDERISFWHNCWHYLVEVSRCEDLQRIMKQCLENEDEINRFKREVLTKSDYVRKRCVRRLRYAVFDVLNEYVSFCCPEPQTASNFKQQLLQSAFFDDGHLFGFAIALEREKFNEFIDEAYNNVDLSTEFKNQFLLWVSELVSSNEKFFTLQHLIEFIQKFVPTEQTVYQIKMRMLDRLKEYGSGYSSESKTLSKCSITSILLWCLGSNEEVEKFKLTYF